MTNETPQTLDGLGRAGKVRAYRARGCECAEAAPAEDNNAARETRSSGRHPPLTNPCKCQKWSGRPSVSNCFMDRHA